MAHQYGRTSCKVCGDEVFVPLQTSPSDGLMTVELTCSNGHTDSYEVSKLEAVRSKPASALKLRRASAGVG